MFRCPDKIHDGEEPDNEDRSKFVLFTARHTVQSGGTGGTSSRSVETLYDSRTDAPSGSQGTSSGEDQVQLSDLSYDLQVLNSESPERSAQLEELSGLVGSGSYEIDSREVSRLTLHEASV